MQLNCGNAAKVPQELRSMRRLQWVSTGRSSKPMEIYCDWDTLYQDDTGAIPQKAAWRLVMPKKMLGPPAELSSRCGPATLIWPSFPSNYSTTGLQVCLYLKLDRTQQMGLRHTIWLDFNFVLLKRISFRLPEKCTQQGDLSRNQPSVVGFWLLLDHQFNGLVLLGKFTGLSPIFNGKIHSFNGFNGLVSETIDFPIEYGVFL